MTFQTFLFFLLFCLSFSSSLSFFAFLYHNFLFVSSIIERLCLLLLYPLLGQNSLFLCTSLLFCPSVSNFFYFWRLVSMSTSLTFSSFHFLAVNRNDVDINTYCISDEILIWKTREHFRAKVKAKTNQSWIFIYLSDTRMITGENVLPTNLLL